jgi:hypothetical protein
MEDLDMRPCLRRSGRPAGLRLLSLVTIAAIVAACGSSAAATQPTGANAAGNPAPAASMAAGGGNAGSASNGGDQGAGGATGGAGGSGDQVADLDAKIIRTGSLQLTVADVDIATRTARDTIRGMGGYVGASQEQRDGESLVATITYRIPAARWEDTLDAIRKLGTVVGEKTDATEVTGQLIDLDARIRNLKASETALVGYAEGAPKISDLLEIQARLTDTRGEIERLSAQQAQLTNQVALATLTVTFGTEVVAVTQAAARWDPAAEVDRASATLLSIVQGVVSFLIVLVIVWLPVLLTAGIVVAIGLAIGRRLGWRRPIFRSYEPPPSPPAPAAEA